METKCPYYHNMIDTLKEVQKMFIGFSEKLQKNLNSLEPSEFELSKKNNSDKEDSIFRKKIKHRKRLSSSCEDLSSTSTDSIQFVPTTVSKSTTKHFAVKLGMISGGVSKTNSSESLNTAYCSL